MICGFLFLVWLTTCCLFAFLVWIEREEKTRDHWGPRPWKAPPSDHPPPPRPDDEADR